jgi:tetratricopeptide (TPR) repeat protein
MKQTLQAVHDIVSGWEGPSTQDLQSFVAALTAADEDTVLRVHFERLERRYLIARNSLMWSIAGIVITILLSVPSLYFYFRDQKERDRQVAVRLQDVESLMDDGHYAGARKLLAIAKEIDPASAAVYLAEMEIEIEESISKGTVSDDLLARAEQEAQKVRDSAHLYSHLGTLYGYKGNVQKSIFYLSKAVELAKKTKNSDLIAKVSHNLGVEYVDLQRVNEAMPLLSAAVKTFCNTAQPSEACADSLYEIARLRMNGQDYSGCIKLLERARPYLSHKPAQTAPFNLLFGECSMANGNLKAAESSVEEAKALFRAAGDARGGSYAAAVLGQIDSKLDQCDSARNLAREAVLLAKQAGVYMMAIRAIGIGSQIEEACGDLREAYIFSVMAQLSVSSTGNEALMRYAKSEVDRLEALQKADVTALDRTAQLRLLELGLPKPL